MIEGMRRDVRRNARTMIEDSDLGELTSVAQRDFDRAAPRATALPGERPLDVAVHIVTRRRARSATGASI
jgi:hypothetical protein